MQQTQPRSNVATGKIFIAFCFAIINYLLFYSIGIILARKLGPVGYDDYHVSVSTITILSALATFGIEKYALKFLPTQYQKEHWSLARTFWKFGLKSITITSLALMLLFWSGYQLIAYLNERPANHAFEVMILFLPVIGITLFLVEIVSVNGRASWATFYYRVTLPLVALILVIFFGQLPSGLDEHRTVAAYGFGWFFAMLGLWFLSNKTMPFPKRKNPGNKEEQPLRKEHLSWVKASSPYLINGLLGSLMAHSGIIILELIHQTETDVGFYAAAMSTANMVVLLATSTNRFFLPDVSLLLEKNDPTALRKLFRKRLFVIGSLSLLFFLTMVVGGRQILLLFGDSFTHSWPALILIAGTNMLSVTFALAPFILHFNEKSNLVTKSRMISIIFYVTLCLLIGPIYGATGIALAFVISFGTFTIFMEVKSRQVIRERFINH